MRVKTNVAERQFGSEVSSCVIDSDDDDKNSKSIGWYVKYHKGKPLKSPVSNKDTVTESGYDPGFAFSKGGDLNLLLC